MDVLKYLIAPATEAMSIQVSQMALHALKNDTPCQTIGDLINAANLLSGTPKPGKKFADTSAEAIINGRRIEIEKGVPLNYQKDVETMLAATDNYIVQFADSLARTYNDSKGKDGPWAWTENSDAFKPKTKMDVLKAISLYKIRVIYWKEKDILEVEISLDDGNLFWGHMIILDAKYDRRSKIFTDQHGGARSNEKKGYIGYELFG